MLLFMPGPSCLDYCSFIKFLKSESMTSSILFFFNTVLAILVPLNSLINGGIPLSVSGWYFGRWCPEPRDKLRKIATVTISRPQLCEHGRLPLHLSRSLLIPASNILLVDR